MPNPKLVAVITALVLIAGAAGARADYSLDQLRALEQLVLGKDTAALGAYLAANRGLTEGDDPLARELRGFLQCVEGGRLDCFASAKTVAAVIGDDGSETSIY